MKKAIIALAMLTVGFGAGWFVCDRTKGNPPSLANTELIEKNRELEEEVAHLKEIVAACIFGKDDEKFSRH